MGLLDPPVNLSTRIGRTAIAALDDVQVHGTSIGNNADQNWLFLGDSTGNAYDEWIFLLIEKLAARYPKIGFDYFSWTASNNYATLTDGGWTGMTPTPAAWSAGTYSVNSYVTVTKSNGKKIIYRANTTTSGNPLTSTDWTLISSRMQLPTEDFSVTTTTTSSSSGSNQINVLNATGIVVGQTVTGTGISGSCKVADLTGIAAKPKSVGATTNSNIVTVSSTTGILVGQRVTSDYIYDICTVVNIDTGTKAITLSSNQSIPNNVDVEFGVNRTIILSSDQTIGNNASLTFRSYYPTVNFYNGSVPGTSFEYMLGRTMPKGVALNPDLIFISTGHNESGIVDFSFENRYMTFLNNLMRLNNRAKIVLCTQNPQTLPATNAGNYQSKRRESIHLLAQQFGFDVLDAYQAFADTGNNISQYLNNDGLHPSPNGSELWSTAATKALDSTKGIVPNIQSKNLFTRTESNLLTNSDFTDYPTSPGLPTNWTGNNVTVNKDLYLKEPGYSWAVQMTPSTTTGSAYIEQDVATTSAEALKYANQWVTAYARFWMSNIDTTTTSLVNNSTIVPLTSTNGIVIGQPVSGSGITGSCVVTGISVPTTGLQATLSTGVATVTLTSGTTTGMVPGQTLTKTSGAGAFGASATVLSIQGPTQFTASINHATTGAITFSTSGAIIALSSAQTISSGTTLTFGTPTSVMARTARIYLSDGRTHADTGASNYTSIWGTYIPFTSSSYYSTSAGTWVDVIAKFLVVSNPLYLKMRLVADSNTSNVSLNSIVTVQKASLALGISPVYI